MMKIITDTEMASSDPSLGWLQYIAFIFQAGVLVLGAIWGLLWLYGKLKSKEKKKGK